MKKMIVLMAGLAFTTMVGAGCSRVMTHEPTARALEESASPSAAAEAAPEESVTQATNPCSASMSYGTGIHRYFGDCGSMVRIIGW